MLIGLITAHHLTWRDDIQYDYGKKAFQTVMEQRRSLPRGEAAIPAKALALTPSDHPPVALAERLGYQVYFLALEHPASNLRYRIVREDSSAVSDGDPLETLADVLAHAPGRKQAPGACGRWSSTKKRPHTASPRRVRLPAAERHCLMSHPEPTELACGVSRVLYCFQSNAGTWPQQ